MKGGSAMRTLILCAAALAGFAAPAAASDWLDIKDPKVLKGAVFEQDLQGQGLPRPAVRPGTTARTGAASW
jgi:hypothetical protein